MTKQQNELAELQDLRDRISHMEHHDRISFDSWVTLTRAVSVAIDELIGKAPDYAVVPVPEAAIKPRRVSMAHDDHPTPLTGTMLDTAGALPEWAWVLWDGSDTPARVPTDELTPARS